MKEELSLEGIERLPKNIRKIADQVQEKYVPFCDLSEKNAEKVANSVRKKTVMDLFHPEPINFKPSGNEEAPTILIFCQGLEGVF